MDRDGVRGRSWPRSRVSSEKPPAAVGVIIAETLELPQEHPVFAELERLENAATLAFATIFLDFTELTIWGGAAPRPGPSHTPDQALD